ncbi:hypothetical protein AB9P05_14270 [Roseivirga sp. BDSF3-8]|uniref:hypothetical protein n=1 Tax=Roseivirga sp. BDSF3-8 TaxID=3241598 RepID=UPI003531FA0D
MENKEKENQKILHTLDQWKKHAGHQIPAILHITRPAEVSTTARRLVVNKIAIDRYRVRYHNADNFYKPVSRMA